MLKKMCPVHMVAGILVIVGALNWGLVGAFKYNLVYAILGSAPNVERVVYVLVGLAAIVMLFACHCKKCNSCCGADDKGCCDGKDKSCCTGDHKA